VLYTIAVAITELRSFIAFVDARPKLRLKNRERLLQATERAASLISYMWFPRIGAPTPYDQFNEANRRASGEGFQFRSPEATPPDQIAASDVHYYRNPLQRLVRLHQGANEIATGFSYIPLW
jgi:hypothetical protein